MRIFSRSRLCFLLVVASFQIAVGYQKRAKNGRFSGVKSWNKSASSSDFRLLTTPASIGVVGKDNRLIHPGSVPPYLLTSQQELYVYLTSIFVTCLIVADVIGVKIFELKFPFSIFGHNTVEHTCGMLTFPITFLLGDIINEYYGPKATKKTVYIGLAMSVLVFIVMNIAQVLPYLNKPFNVTPEAFNMIFGSAKLMYVASISAYLVGQLMDIWLFGVIKRITKGKLLWLRATGSTLISQLMDSFVVSYVAFSLGKSVTNQTPATLAEVWNIAITGYGLKFIIAFLITPILYALRHIMHNHFKLEPLPVDYKD